MKHTDNKTWKVVAEIVMALLSILALLPFLLLFISSITDNTWATANGFSFFLSRQKRFTSFQTK